MNLFGTSPNRVGWLVILAWGVGAQPDSPAQADSQELGRARGVLVEEVRNENPSFMVRIDVDHPDRIYRQGEEMRVRVISEKAGYLYLIYCDAGGNMVRLFPNNVEQNNSIPAGQHVQVPPPGGRFRLRIGPPFGQEVLKAIVSLEPIDPDQVIRMVTPEGVKGLYVEEMKNRPAEWAEHDVTTTTVPPEGATPPQGTVSTEPQAGNTAPPTTVPPITPPPITAPPTTVPQTVAGGPRRVGVFIGISDFLDPGIRDLKVGEKDALAMADVMKRTCGLDEAWTLVGPQASLKNIEDAIRTRLPAATRAGDVVVIYWSGHGARCADDNGDERDGFDEYLVPYDGRFADEATIRRTMLLDDTIGRWLQELDGRKLVVILDTCHSGGQSTQEKSLAKGLGDPVPAGGGVVFDFLDGEMERAKDIGQEETAMLASSTAMQVSFERKEGDLSTMTYFLVQQLSAQSGAVTLPSVYENLKRQVASYVEQAFPGTTQTPVLVDNMTPPFYLRP
ncbi:MAG TPA: DUF4384 domain-containing protein [Thermoguttaceae bacterium]|nr:DUF4384 domain-containing protein [Thermoguttaceae bacterium]